MFKMRFAVTSIVLVNVVACSRQTTQTNEPTQVHQVSNDVPASRVCSTQWPHEAISPPKERHPKQRPTNQESLVGKLYSDIVAAQSLEMAVIRRYEWRLDNDPNKPVRHELRVAFLNGEPEVQDRIMKTASLDYSRSL